LGKEVARPGRFPGHCLPCLRRHSRCPGVAAEHFILARRLAGSSFTSEVVISPDGRFLYAANRLHDTIAICSIGRDGRDFFYVCNQRSDNIVCFKVRRDTDLLTFTGQYTPVGMPSIVTFLS
jgi:6-phosphogluconolactonase